MAVGERAKTGWRTKKREGRGDLAFSTLVLDDLPEEKRRLLAFQFLSVPVSTVDYDNIFNNSCIIQSGVLPTTSPHF